MEASIKAMSCCGLGSRNNILLSTRNSLLFLELYFPALLHNRKDSQLATPPVEFGVASESDARIQGRSALSGVNQAFNATIANKASKTTPSSLSQDQLIQEGIDYVADLPV